MTGLKKTTILKLFLVGVIATLVYKYMQLKGRDIDLVPPQMSETDRPLANGRMEFWKADGRLNGDVATDGNTPQAKELAKALIDTVGPASDTRVYCVMNERQDGLITERYYLFLVKSSVAVDETRIWEKARELVAAQAQGVPTIGIGVRDMDDYRLVIVGGPDPKPILVKYDGPFTLYPYFYRAQGLNDADAR